MVQNNKKTEKKQKTETANDDLEIKTEPPS